jgi:multiple sugar transport system substrate-binding protein
MTDNSNSAQPSAQKPNPPASSKSGAPMPTPPKVQAMPNPTLKSAKSAPPLQASGAVPKAPMPPAPAKISNPSAAGISAPPALPKTEGNLPLPSQPPVPAPASGMPPKPGLPKAPAPISAPAPLPTPSPKDISAPPSSGILSAAPVSLPRPPSNMPNPGMKPMPTNGPSSQGFPPLGGAGGPPKTPVGSAPLTPPKPGAPAAPPAGGPVQPPQAGKSAEVKQSPLKFLPFIVGGLILVGVLIFFVSKLFGPKTTSSVKVDNTVPDTSQTNVTTKTVIPTNTGSSGSPVTLTYWGLWEPSDVLQEVISDYELSHPGIKISYQQQSYKSYRERLQTAIVGGKGPDIFRFHSSWVPMLGRELSNIPGTIMNSTEFDSTFYPIAAQQLKVNGQPVGIPLMYDGLGLYYNSDILKTANVQPPSTWADLKALASQLTIRNGDKIQRSGVALGNTSNVEHFADILGLLILQNGANPTRPDSQPAQDAMQFYTNFAKTDKVWDSTLPSSTVAFARGDVVMMFAPSWRAHDIKALNPNLKFGIAPVPQLSANKVTWATYWAEGVNIQSTHQTEAWAFLKYMSSADTLKKLYASASKERSFGEIYPRKDLASLLSTDPYISSYLTDAPYAKNWYMNSYTFDNGLNDQLIKYYEDAINAVNSGEEVSKAMDTVEQGTTQILRQYSVPVQQ